MHAVRTCFGVIAVGRVLKTACDSGMTQQAQSPLKCFIPRKQGPWRNIALMASEFIVFTLTSIFFFYKKSLICELMLNITTYC